jgi:hypothetical protein
MPGFRKGASSDNPDRIKNAGDTFRRDKSTIERLRMYRCGACWHAAVTGRRAV